MKIELDINDLKTTIDGLNNAIIAYNDIRNAIYIMGGIPDGISEKWKPFIVGKSLENLTEKFDERLKELKYIYQQLEDKEKENDNKRTEVSINEGQI